MIIFFTCSSSIPFSNATWNTYRSSLNKWCWSWCWRLWCWCSRVIIGVRFETAAELINICQSCNKIETFLEASLQNQFPSTFVGLASTVPFCFAKILSKVEITVKCKTLIWGQYSPDSGLSFKILQFIGSDIASYNKLVHSWHKSKQNIATYSHHP